MLWIRIRSNLKLFRLIGSGLGKIRFRNKIPLIRCEVSVKNKNAKVNGFLVGRGSDSVPDPNPQWLSRIRIRPGPQVQVPDPRPLFCYPPLCPVHTSWKSLGLALSSLSLFYIFLWKKVKQCRLFTSLFMHPELVEMCCKIHTTRASLRYKTLFFTSFVRWGGGGEGKAWTGDYAARVYRTLIRC